MRIFGWLGLISTVGLLLALNVGTAAATTLCKEAKNPCPAGQQHPVGESFTLEIAMNEKSEFIGEKTFQEAKCSIGSPKFSTVKNEGAGKVLLGSWTEFKFSSCTGCTGIEEPSKPYQAEIMPLPGGMLGEGLVTISDSGKGLPKFKFSSCPLGITCTFGAKNVNLEIYGAGSIVSVLSEPLTFETGSSFCGSKATWKVNFWTAKPAEKRMYVVAEP